VFFRRGTLTAIAGFAAVAALTAACSPLPPAKDDATRFPDAARESADVVALFRAADALVFEKRRVRREPRSWAVSLQVRTRRRWSPS
jgi:hypothetical protein